ncbi:hypothetical protein CROQUDRAFT_664956 [Cronartium quercuum f. sp. fusiforme G11]|uniref:Uncharacterized protein n=1 Tax=Cronartium quercuum f. sp. fusiforme G11 TaxID=708437 RepID=A0A9P6T633_9BASI|nr:hypothetical protein CROQUDRAFT_664956 [Cronartium quercuum f. sp. fusiforme G11]
MTKNSLENGLKLYNNLSGIQEKLREQLHISQVQFPIKRRQYLTTPATDSWKSLQKVEKGRASIIFQLRSGHIALKS